jgi:putative ABC transport system permease protein
MKMFKRATISIVRRPGKFLVLFMIVFILATLTSGAISISQAVINTEKNLLRRIPPVATLEIDSEGNSAYFNANDEWPEIKPLTSDLLEEIGSLPYVRAYDFATFGWFYSNDLNFPTDLTPYLDVYWLEDEGLMQMLTLNSYRSESEGAFEILSVKGIYNPNVIDLEEGIIELVAGRVFTEEEIINNQPVVLLPEGFAKANNLAVGSTFPLEARIYDTFTFTNSFSGYFEAGASLIDSKEIELEVIGIFAPTVVMDDDANGVNLDNHIQLNGQLIYAPHGVARLSRSILFDYVETHHPEDLSYHPLYDYRDVIFALHDSLDLEAFNLAATVLLPDFWQVTDLSHEFDAISNSMAVMQEIANGMMIGVPVASLTVLGLLIVLFLRDRKGEIGIYLALGESKRNVMVQIVIEVVTVSVFAIVLALFMGHLLSDQIAISMLRQDLIDNPNVFPNLNSNVRDFNAMGFSTHMTGEEMLEAYSVSLDTVTIVIFFSVAMGMILLAVMLPAIYLMQFNPKDILMKASVG